MGQGKYTPPELAAFQKNKYNNPKQSYKYEERWVTIEELAELAQMTTAKAQRLLRWGKTPKQVVDFKKDCS